VIVAAAKKANESMYEDTVVCNGVAITFLYCHSRRRTIGMTIKPDKSVNVRAPLRTQLPAIRAFVAKNAAWIARTWEKIDGQSQAPAQSYRSGALFLFLGKEYRLVLEHGERESVRLQPGALVVTTPGRPSHARLAELVDTWYRKRAASLFQKRLAVFHQLVHPNRTVLPSLTIRSMTSRWGSYSYRTRRVTLNLQLIRLPLAYLDYVVIHELCHITVRHHGPGFWRHVERYVPEHVEVRRDLRGFVGFLH
jgi:predicted metal-dependent hydrolase